MNIKFTDYREKIIQELNNKKVFLGINEPVSLIDGFINQPIQQELSGNIVIGGPTIPMVAVVGNNSGRIYYFALKALLPSIGI
ncbi:TPA: hypothetical protein JBI72_01310 [Legionella pneumophila]|uniref:Uncharacterized protein n=2 Tax=Legionella TaxID=445 RepID=A0A378JC10_9GAMM|nr:MULTISPECIES: hypothetical protein [Legionella]HAT8891761.1 hypothetical protein [Legionella pneumophila subsp. pneumophila]ADG25270.1 hypothetical protein lpa_02788 [Legionella pneumophila 2300/99 Alcoy]KTD15512.1 hypothetical protein Lgra_0178 [Legionella gratiana]MCK1858858.1 hypothetical protein [Legionella pneumophila]MCZ4687540.1 hypothetical protein [Legionella pneumophila]